MSTLLFSPLKGEQTVDASMVTLALARLAETNRDRSRFTPIVHGKLSAGREPDEIIIICLDQSWSMEESGEFAETVLPEAGDEDPITRVLLPLGPHTNGKMQLVKEIFNIFINRTIAYNYVHHIGLVTFDSDAQVAQPITPVLEDLRSAVLNIESHGLTALWKALLIAERELSAYSHNYPSAKKRILALSDGENNIEPFSAHEICLKLQVLLLKEDGLFREKKYSCRQFCPWRCRK